MRKSVTQFVKGKGNTTVSKNRITSNKHAGELRANGSPAFDAEMRRHHQATVNRPVVNPHFVSRNRNQKNHAGIDDDLNFGERPEFELPHDWSLDIMSIHYLMRLFSSLLILITLTCPVMCRDDVGCCGQSDGGVSPSQRPVCCSHCMQHNSESAPEEEVPTLPGRPCACSCLCGGAVVVESVSLPELPVVWFVMDLWVPMPPESVTTGTMRGDSYLYERCPIAGYTLRIVECSLRC